MNIEKLSGLELMKGMLEGRIPRTGNLFVKQDKEKFYEKNACRAGSSQH